MFSDDTMNVMVLRRALSEMALRQIILTERIEELAQAHAHLVARVNHLEEGVNVGGELREDSVCPHCDAHS